jgi:DNA-binding LacI/PurR family transcriptional regulator
MRALAKAGISVPEQCSVTGFDDVAISALSAPSLTTVRQPLETMGGTAVSIVLDAIKAGHENRDWGPVSQKLHPELVIRDSTRSN